MPRKYVILLALTLGVVLLDQWTKYVAVRELTTRFDGQPTLSARLSAFYGEPPPEGYDGNHFRSRRMVTLSEDFFRFRYAENKGAAFSLFGNLPPNVRGPFFHLVSLGAVVLILLYYRKVSPGAPGAKWQLYGLPLVLGGAVGNYVDRLARGFVIDFAEAHWFHKAYWPAFNVADTAICIGVGMLLLDGLLHREGKAAAGASSP